MRSQIVNQASNTAMFNKIMQLLKITGRPNDVKFI